MQSILEYPIKKVNIKSIKLLKLHRNTYNLKIHISIKIRNLKKYFINSLLAQIAALSDKKQVILEVDHSLKLLILRFLKKLRNLKQEITEKNLSKFILNQMIKSLI